MRCVGLLLVTILAVNAAFALEPVSELMFPELADVVTPIQAAPGQVRKDP